MQRTPVAIVTGASGNLGNAVALRLTALGYRVARVERSVMHFAEEYDCEIDLADLTSVRRAFAEVARRAGKLDALVHTVGADPGEQSVIDTGAAEYLAQFHTHVMTTVHVLRAALPLMHAQHEGAIAVVSSREAEQAAAGRAAFAASRAAQLRVVQSAAEEARAFGVRINAILPDTLDTPDNRAAMPEADRSSWLQLRHVAEVLSFLVSPAAAAIHGQALKL